MFLFILFGFTSEIDCTRNYLLTDILVGMLECYIIYMYILLNLFSNIFVVKNIILELFNNVRMHIDIVDFILRIIFCRIRFYTFDYYLNLFILIYILMILVI